MTLKAAFFFVENCFFLLTFPHRFSATEEPFVTAPNRVTSLASADISNSERVEAKARATSSIFHKHDVNVAQRATGSTHCIMFLILFSMYSHFSSSFAGALSIFHPKNRGKALLDMVRHESCTQVERECCEHGNHVPWHIPACGRTRKKK